MLVFIDFIFIRNKEKNIYLSNKHTTLSHKAGYSGQHTAFP